MSPEVPLLFEVQGHDDGVLNFHIDTEPFSLLSCGREPSARSSLAHPGGETLRSQPFVVCWVTGCDDHVSRTPGLMLQGCFW